MRTLILLYVIAIVVFVIGWISNLVALISMIVHDHAITVLFVARLVGVPVAFLGAVLGYF